VPAVLLFLSGAANTRGRAGSVADWIDSPCGCGMARHLDDYHCCAEMRGSFQETAPRKTTKNTVKQLDGGVGSVVANHRGGGENLVVVTTLCTIMMHNSTELVK